MDKGGPVDEASFSGEAPWRGPRGGSSFTGDPGRYVKKSPDTDISLHGDPFPFEGNLVCGGARKPGTLIDK